jgi:uncharacterized membrane protein YkvA (DUF1232 family)
MAENQDPKRNIVPRSGGFFQDLTNRFRLISRLLMDGRVHPLIKILPVATLAYVILPADLLPVNPIDDAFVVWIGTTLFVELCPPAVVQEHLQLLDRWPVSGQRQDNASPTQEGDVVDGEFFETDPNKPK